MSDLGMVVGLMSTAVAGLAGAVAHLFVVVRVELNDCKKDRQTLFAEAKKGQLAIAELLEFMDGVNGRKDGS